MPRDFQNHTIVKFERSSKDRSNCMLNCFYRFQSTTPNHFYLKNYIVYRIYLSKMIYYTLTTSLKERKRMEENEIDEKELIRH